ncbi:MAG: hypothetical protein AB1599_04550 [Planctomycetota bacterium]
MKTNLIIAVVLIVFVILSGALAAFLLPRLINRPDTLLNQAKIVKYAAGQSGPSDTVEEYNLWLEIEMPRPAFDNIFEDGDDASSTDTPVKKDEMKTERLATENPVKDILVIRGYASAGAVTDTGAPLRINKSVILAKENLKPLDDREALSHPQVVSSGQFQPLTDIYYTDEGAKSLLYIHLESNIKQRATRNQLSLTITYLKDNRAVLSQTLPLFRY